VSAIVDEIPYLTYFLMDPRYKKEFEMVNRNNSTPGLGFVSSLSLLSALLDSLIKSSL
jgi:hypothetical protein